MSITLYNQHEAPVEVDNLAQFCRRNALSLQKMRDVVRGKTRSHFGWHIDPKRADAHEKRTQEIRKLLGKTDEFEVVMGGGQISGKSPENIGSTVLEKWETQS